MTMYFAVAPEFEERLTWIAEFVREEIYQLEALGVDRTAVLTARGALKAHVDALSRQVKEVGLWAAHMDADHGGAGLRQVELALMHEILGRSDLAPASFRAALHAMS